MYVNDLGLGQLVPALAASVAPGSLTSAAVIAEHACIGNQVEIRRIAIAISTATVSTGNIVVTVRNRPTVGSATGQSTLATLTIPTGVAAGKVYYKDVNQSVVVPGGSIAFEVTTAAAGGSAAGAGVCGYIAQEDPEYAPNLSSMVVSA